MPTLFWVAALFPWAHGVFVLLLASGLLFFLPGIYLWVGLAISGAMILIPCALVAITGLVLQWKRLAGTERASTLILVLGGIGFDYWATTGLAMFFT